MHPHLTDRRYRPEPPRRDPFQALPAHGRGHSLPVNTRPVPGQRGLNPGCPINSGRIRVRPPDLRIQLRPHHGPFRRNRASSAPRIEPGPGHPQKPGHPLDRVVSLLGLHQLEAFRFCCLEAKKAAAFPRNSLSIRNCAFSRRNRSNSDFSVSAAANSSGASSRARSCATHRPSNCSPRPSSRATGATGLPVSMTRRAASRRYSGVNLRRVVLTRTPSRRIQGSRYFRCPPTEVNPKPQLAALFRFTYRNRVLAGTP